MKLQSVTIYFLALFLFSTTEVASQPDKAATVNGIWQSKGYGQIVIINETEAQLYDICSLSCTPNLRVTRAIFDQEFEVKAYSDTTLTLKESIGEYDFIKLSQLPDVCQQNSNKQNDPLYNFETLWTTFQEHYCYFEVRGIDWLAMKATYKTQITSKTTPFELFLLFDEMLEEIGDGHVTMFVPDELQKKYAKHQKKEFKKRKKTSASKKIGVNTETVRHALVDRYVKEKQVYNFGAIIWGKINQELMLVQINGMNELANYNIPKEYSENKAMKEYEKKAAASKNYTQDEINGAGYIMDKIVREAQNAKAIILDIRLNGGGYDGVGMEFLRRFINAETTVFTKKAKAGTGFTRPQAITIKPIDPIFLGKVFILTSPATASAAESFTLAAMEAIPDAIRIGDNTRGIFSDRLEKKLPNGWEYGLSNEVYESMEGLSYEGIGIPPHHSIPFHKKKTFWVFHQLKEELEKGLGDQAIEMILKMDLKE